MPSQPSATVASSRDRLLQAAKRLFAHHGYEHTATSAIAREAGTSESQLMRYFGGKIGLLDALFEEAWKELNDRVRKVVGTSTTAREALSTTLQTMASAFARDAELATLFLFEGRRLRGEAPRMRVSHGFATFSEIARNLVRRGQAERAIDPTLDAAAVTSALLGATESMIRDRIVTRDAGGRGFAEREIRRTVNAMLDGFQGGRMARPLRSPRLRPAKAR